MAGKIIIDAEKCKGCGLCVAVCPKNCIIISSRSNKKGYFPAEAKDNGKCTGCAVCAIICPDAAIEVFRDDEAVTVEVSNKASCPSREIADGPKGAASSGGETV